MQIKKSAEQYWMESDQQEKIAELSFTEDKQTLTITHTFVEPDHREKGLGAKLIAALVDDARKNKQKIDPVCPYADAQFEQHSEYKDVLL